MPPPHPWFAVWPPDLPHTIAIPAATLIDQLDAAAARVPDKAAIVFGDRSISFRALRAEVDALAGHLQHRAGVEAGSRVLLLGQNGPQWSAAFLAVQRCGAVVVPLNAMASADEVAHVLADSGASVALVDAALLPAVRPALADGRLQHAVVHGDSDKDNDTAAPPPNAVAWPDAIGAGLAPRPVATTPDDLCLLPYTSGTTGRPKGCRHSHRTLLASTFAAIRWRGLDAAAVVLGVAPLFHLLGLQNALLMPLAVGATVVLMPRWDAAAAARLIERHRVSVWAAPPAMLIDFFAHPAATQHDLSSLKMLNGGGAAMPDAVAAMLSSRFGLTYIEGYGLTETASFLHCNPLDRPRRQCLGIPAFGVDSRIVDPETLAELPPGEVGELVTSAPQLMLGYWRNPAADAAAFFDRDGRRFFRTGDLAHMDGDGYFHMRDRLKRMINVSGWKVWPAELESRLHEHPAVHEACIVAVADARQGEAVKAVVVRKPGHDDLDAAALQAWCRDRMAAYKVPRWVEFRTALPRSPSGKVAWRAVQDEQALPPDRRIPFLDTIGMRRVRVGGGEAVVAIDLQPALLNNHGAGHGGVVMTLLDSAMANAALSRIDFAREVVTVAVQVGFLQPAAGALLQATGRATGGGRSLCFCEADVTDADGRVVARAMGTFRYRD